MSENDYSWTREEVINAAGYGPPIAAYRCHNCQNIVPVNFTRTTEEPPQDLPNYPCGPKWDGCDEWGPMTLVSEGFLED